MGPGESRPFGDNHGAQGLELQAVPVIRWGVWPPLCVSGCGDTPPSRAPVGAEEGAPAALLPLSLLSPRSPMFRIVSKLQRVGKQRSSSHVLTAKREMLKSMIGTGKNAHLHNRLAQASPFSPSCDAKVMILHREKGTLHIH